MEEKGIIMFNRGERMVVNAIVSLYSLRKHWDGNITFFVEDDYPHEFDQVLQFFNCNIVHNEKRHELKTLIRKNSMFGESPYLYTLWLDIDIIVNAPVDKMFDYLIENDVDLCIPSFCGWVSSGNHISKRIKGFKGIIEDKYIEEALKEHPAINTGILSFKNTEKWRAFVRDWTGFADIASKKGQFIADEVACQILYPSISDWGLKACIAPSNYNVSPIHDHGLSKKPVIFHYHGSKNCLPNNPTCDIWKTTFKEMTDSNIANINSFLKYADKRLKAYLKGDKQDAIEDEYKTENLGTAVVTGKNSDVTIVTACDPHYIEILKVTYKNWQKYKNIDSYPVIVFYNGMEKSDSRLDFLRLPNVTLIPWNEDSMDKVDSHRELMLSAFVLGTAKYVETDYWIKLDADTYATNDKPLYDESFKQYSMVSHKWGYSRPEFIKKLDEWAKGHWKSKLKNATPMINEGRIDGNRFYHNKRRNISFIQFHKTRFIKFCVSLLKENRLPVPSHDTFTYFVCQKFNPEAMLLKNFKKEYGFTQGSGKKDASFFVAKMQEVDDINSGIKASNLMEDSDGGDGGDGEDQVENKAEVISITKTKAMTMTMRKLFPIIKNQLDLPLICRVPEGNDCVAEIKEIK